MKRALPFVLLLLLVLLLIAGLSIARFVALDTKKQTVEIESRLPQKILEQRVIQPNKPLQQMPEQIPQPFDLRSLATDDTELLDRDSLQGRLPPNFTLEGQTVESKRPQPDERQKSLQSNKQIPKGGTKTARLAIVLDDVGVNQGTARRAIALQTPITISLMSYAKNANKLSDIAIKNGHELMLHLPMQPEGNQDPGPHALLVQTPFKQLEKNLDWGLSQFQGYQGVNNHMGSLFTQWPKGMRLVMRRLRSRGAFFLDSRTTSNSYAKTAAEEIGIPFAQRDIFIDNDQSVSAILEQLHKAEKIARDRGFAIAIGHPHDSTLEALESWLPTAGQRGLSIVPVHEIIAATKD